MITIELAKKLIATQFPEYSGLHIIDVEQQGHDNRTYRIGNDMLIRMPTAESYALKVPKEHVPGRCGRQHLNSTILKLKIVLRFLCIKELLMR